MGALAIETIRAIQQIADDARGSPVAPEFLTAVQAVAADHAGVGSVEWLTPKMIQGELKLAAEKAREAAGALEKLSAIRDEGWALSIDIHRAGWDSGVEFPNAAEEDDDAIRMIRALADRLDHRAEVLAGGVRKGRYGSPYVLLAYPLAEEFHVYVAPPGIPGGDTETPFSRVVGLVLEDLGVRQHNAGRNASVLAVRKLRRRLADCEADGHHHDPGSGEPLPWIREEQDQLAAFMQRDVPKK